MGCLLGGHCGIKLYQIAEKKRLSQIGHTLSEGYFQNMLLSGLARILLQQKPGKVFEIKAEDAVWKVSFEHDDIVYRKKE